MPTLEELLKTNNQSLSSFLDTYGSKKEDNEEDIVSDALVAPARPEYLALLDKVKKEKAPRPEGMRSLLGASSPEEIALKQLEEYDALKTAPSGAKSNFQTGKQKDYEAFFNKAKSNEPLTSPSAPFYPTPTGAPVAETPVTTSQAAARLPASLSSSSKQAAVSPEKESDVSALLKSAGDESSQYQDLLARYKDAEERQRLAQLGVSLGQAGERIGSAIAMVKPGDQAIYEQLAKQAGGITEQFKEEETVAREARRNDPNSPESEAARALLKEQGITVPKTVTAAFIEKQYPQFANIINRKEAAKQDAIRRAERAQDRQDRMLERLDFKQREEALRLAPKIQNKKYDTYTELNAQKNLVDEAVSNPSPQRDITVYYSFVKALDPESVVREGELKFVQTSRSIPNNLRGALQRALTGKPMLPEERLEIQKFMNQRLELARRQWEDSAKPFIAQAEKAGISRELIAPGTTALTALAESKQKETIKLPQKQTGKAGKTIVSKDGKRYVINADETTATEL